MILDLEPGECVLNPYNLPHPSFNPSTLACVCRTMQVHLTKFKLNLLLDSIGVLTHSISVGLRKEYEVAIDCRLACLPIRYLNT
jgi:hypothetical protein